MPSAFSRAVLFLSAYSPLLALFAVLDSFHRAWASWVCGGLAALGLVLIAVFWQAAKRVGAEEITVVRVTRRDEDVLAFFVTYVVPFAVAPIDSTRVAIALVSFLAFIGLLYLRAGMYRVHPILLLAGYHLYELETTDKTQPSVAYFSREMFIENGSLDVRSIAPGVFTA